MLWRLGCASLFLALMVLAGTCWTVYNNWSDARRDEWLAESNQKYLDALGEVLIDLRDAETGQRGYLLTGRDDYLEPYKKALQTIQAGLEQLSAVAKERPDQKASIDIIQTQTRLKLAELALTIDLRRTKGFEAALSEVLTDTGKTAMDEVRRECENTSRSISADLVKRSAEVSVHQRNAIEVAAGGSSLLLLLMIGGFVTLISGANRQAHFAERLAESREIFETTLTSIGDGVIATDLTGTIIFTNPEAANLTGWSRTEAVGKPLKEILNIVNELTRVGVESPFDKVIQTGGIAGLANHTILIRKDGSEVPIDDSGAPIRNVNGDTNGVVVVFRGIAERRAAEASLQYSNNELLKANEELRQFSYAATHDLQEPLRTIVVFSQLLSRSYAQVLDDRGQHLLQTVEGAAHRMSELIDDLLAYSRAGGLDAAADRATVVDASAVLNDALVQLDGAMVESHATITADPLPLVLSEAAQLSQVFLNLLSNAIKYRKPDVPPLIHISSTIAGDTATFRISDNGIGFKPEYADKIFLMFQRLHGRSIPGTGIGLALCRRILERNGGRIWADSEENVGSSFYFTLPVVQKPDAFP